MILRLYRGISVDPREAADIMHRIKIEGLNVSEVNNRRTFPVKNIKANLSSLFNNPKLSQEDTRPSFVEIKDGYSFRRKFIGSDNYICFADPLGAEYYALEHNKVEKDTCPIIIEANIDIKDVVVDGRDFLFSFFSTWNPDHKPDTNKLKNILNGIYGRAIDPYLDKLIENPESDRFAICDLALQDEEVIKAHYENKVILGGRYGTIFKSAFMAKIPILAENIVCVKSPERERFTDTPQLTLGQIHSIINEK